MRSEAAQAFLWEGRRHPCCFLLLTVMVTDLVALLLFPCLAWVSTKSLRTLTPALPGPLAAAGAGGHYLQGSVTLTTVTDKPGVHSPN